MVEAVNNFLENNLDIIFLILTGLCIILLVMCISQGIKLSNLSKRVDRFLGSRKERRSLESRLMDYSGRVRRLDEKYDEIRLNILDINKRLSFCIQKVGLVRYNPFEDMGGDFCFALALLDENDYGVVINTIHGRESSYTYAKSIIGLECKYSLSNEEKAAVMLAIENESRDEVFIQNKNQERRVTIRRKIERKHEEASEKTTVQKMKEPPGKAVKKFGEQNIPKADDIREIDDMQEIDGTQELEDMQEIDGTQEVEDIQGVDETQEIEDVRKAGDVKKAEFSREKEVYREGFAEEPATNDEKSFSFWYEKTDKPE